MTNGDALAASLAALNQTLRALVEEVKSIRETVDGMYADTEGGKDAGDS